jgi:uncharacterized membrane protein HdeD (DUF308 family)
MKPGEFNFHLAIPSGIILTILGILVLITPLTTAVPSHQVKVDIVAGSMMMLSGIICLLWGLYRSSHR